MSERNNDPSRATRLGFTFLAGYEPAPAQFIVRQPYYPWLVIGMACMAGLIGQLDASIVQLILPTLEHDFGARLSAVSWVAVAYTLASASSLPVLARLAAVTGRKLMFLGGFLLFMLDSALCGLAADLTQLIAYRTLQGIGGAMLAANSLVILIRAAGPSRQGRHWHLCSDPSRRRHCWSRGRRCAARRTQLALGVLGECTARICRGGDWLVRDPANHRSER